MPSTISRSRCPVALLILITLGLAVICAPFSFAQQTTAPATSPSPTGKPSAADFAAAADEVLAQMSQITGLDLRSPLKKSLRSREEIRAHVIQEMNEDKNAAERYAGARSAEAFGLLPKGFDLDSFMIDLLTEQIAGLYDPKTHEFYVADWIPIDDQRRVMAHELTHALEDQHFQIEAWEKAARPNDDSERARESVLEGSAMVAMVEYLLEDSGRSLKDLPDIDPAMLIGDMGEFGWKEVLKQFLGEPRAKPLSSAWDGDRYAVYEQKPTKRLLLITRERLATPEQAVRFFGQYSEALEKKHEKRSNLVRKPDFFSFDTPDGGVFLRCFEKECVTLEGGDPALFLKFNKELQWTPVPEAPKVLAREVKEVASRAETAVTFP